MTNEPKPPTLDPAVLHMFIAATCVARAGRAAFGRIAMTSPDGIAEVALVSFPVELWARVVGPALEAAGVQVVGLGPPGN